MGEDKFSDGRYERRSRLRRVLQERGATNSLQAADTIVREMDQSEQSALRAYRERMGEDD